MQRPWAETQSAFAAAMLDPQLPLPEDVIGCDSSRGHGTLAIHRNNALAGSVDALQERFPVTCQLVGEAFFRAMARLYVDEHRPRSPLLIYYGDDLPDFIERFEPASAVPYLPDVARLEAARSQAYHSSESRALQPHSLTSVSPGALLEMRLTLHPSTRILSSSYPIADIWAAHQHSGEVTPPSHWDAQDVLIVRPDAEVHLHILKPGVYTFVAALLDERNVQDAAHAAFAADTRFDPGSSIVDLFNAGAIVAFGIVDTQER